MNLNQAIATTTAWGATILLDLWYGVFTLISTFFPYIVGILVIGLFISLAFRLIRRARVS